MNTTIIAMSIAAIAAIGLVVTLGIVSLLSGSFHFLVAKPKLNILKSEFGDNGFAFSFTWNSSMEPAKFDKVKVRLFNPFGSPTQVEVSKAFDGATSDFARDVYMGSGMKRLLGAQNIEKSTVEIEVTSSKDSLTQSFQFKGAKFMRLLSETRETVKTFDSAKPAPAGKPLYQSVQRTFIADTLPESMKTIRLATNPEFAGDFATAGSASTEAQVNFDISKVWIEPGCIVCNACEAIYPEVFEVTDDSCLIRPEAPLNDGLKIQEAAEACPVEVIKFTQVG